MSADQQLCSASGREIGLHSDTNTYLNRNTSPVKRTENSLKKITSDIHGKGNIKQRGNVKPST
jgi:hypothetical protein